jgi:uncharacterized membrane protein
MKSSKYISLLLFAIFLTTCAGAYAFSDSISKYPIVSFIVTIAAGLSALLWPVFFIDWMRRLVREKRGSRD